MPKDDVSGIPPFNPNNQRMYEQEYRQSADLFRNALNQYAKSENPYQKAEFKSVMDKAMQLLNATANGLMRKELQKKNEQIARDYANFQKFPEDGDTIQKLNQDLQNAKNSIR